MDAIYYFFDESQDHYYASALANSITDLIKSERSLGNLKLNITSMNDYTIPLDKIECIDNDIVFSSFSKLKYRIKAREVKSVNLRTKYVYPPKNAGVQFAIPYAYILIELEGNVFKIEKRHGNPPMDLLKPI